MINLNYEVDAKKEFWIILIAVIIIFIAGLVLGYSISFNTNCVYAFT